MDLGWGNELASKFVTGVGLITSDGPNGPNVMAAEWTYYVSWSPALIAVHVGGEEKGKATAENISKSGEFGVSIASEDQRVVASIAGGSSGREVDKVAVLKEMGAEFYQGSKIRALMVKGAATNAECRLLESRALGDHTMFVGEILDIKTDQSKRPLAYSFGKYYVLGEQLHRPEQAVLDRIEALRAKYSKRK